MQSRDNNAMHAKSGLRVVLKWKIYRPDSVIADVITLSLPNGMLNANYHNAFLAWGGFAHCDLVAQQECGLNQNASAGHSYTYMDRLHGSHRGNFGHARVRHSCKYHEA